MLSEQRPEHIWNKGGCLHGGGRNGDANRAQGRIQMGSESGMSIEVWGDDCGAIKEALAFNKIEIE